jgi:hypothetical protein
MKRIMMDCARHLWVLLLVAPFFGLLCKMFLSGSRFNILAIFSLFFALSHLLSKGVLKVYHLMPLRPGTAVRCVWWFMIGVFGGIVTTVVVVMDPSPASLYLAWGLLGANALASLIWTVSPAQGNYRSLILALVCMMAVLCVPAFYNDEMRRHFLAANHGLTVAHYLGIVLSGVVLVLSWYRIERVEAWTSARFIPPKEKEPVSSPNLPMAPKGHSSLALAVLQWLGREAFTGAALGALFAMGLGIIIAQLKTRSPGAVFPYHAFTPAALIVVAAVPVCTSLRTMRLLPLPSWCLLIGWLLMPVIMALALFLGLFFVTLGEFSPSEQLGKLTWFLGLALLIRSAVTSLTSSLAAKLSLLVASVVGISIISLIPLLWAILGGLGMAVTAVVWLQYDLEYSSSAYRGTSISESLLRKAARY